MSLELEGCAATPEIDTDNIISNARVSFGYKVNSAFTSSTLDDGKNGGGK